MLIWEKPNTATVDARPMSTSAPLTTPKHAVVFDDVSQTEDLKSSKEVNLA